MWIQKDNALINDDGKVIKHIEIPVKSGKWKIEHDYDFTTRDDDRQGIPYSRLFLIQ